MPKTANHLVVPSERSWRDRENIVKAGSKGVFSESFQMESDQ